MARTINITEKQLKRLVEDSVENNNHVDVEDELEYLEPEEGGESEFEKLQDILTPEEITGLLEDQIVQLQDRTQYLEELQADMMEFTEALMSDLTNYGELPLKRSTQKLRALETRGGIEIFWLKSRRL